MEEGNRLDHGRKKNVGKEGRKEGKKSGQSKQIGSRKEEEEKM